MMNEDTETIRLLREILKWTRFSGMKEVKPALGTALETAQKRLIYQLSDGDRGSVEIAKAAGVSDWTVRNYWKIWSRIGLVESIKSGGGNRFRHAFELEDFGIEVPKAFVGGQETTEAQALPADSAETSEKVAS